MPICHARAIKVLLRALQMCMSFSNFCSVVKNPKVETNMYWESEGRRPTSLWTALTDIIREVGQLQTSGGSIQIHVIRSLKPNMQLVLLLL